jgi:hypothetical protein
MTVDLLSQIQTMAAVVAAELALLEEEERLLVVVQVAMDFSGLMALIMLGEAALICILQLEQILECQG